MKSRDQLMDAAYGETIYVDDRTIDSHIKRIRKKFRAVDNDFGQIETLYGVGYQYKETRGRPPDQSASPAGTYAPPVSRLTIRIRHNLLALALVAIGSLVLDRYRDQLVQAELRAMALQAEVLAQALGDAMVDGTTAVALTPPLISRLILSSPSFGASLRRWCSGSRF